MLPKVKPDDNDFRASARTFVSNERERQMHALYEEPPHIPIKIPFIKPETIDAYVFSVLILRFRLRQCIQFLTQNIYFTTGYVLSCLVAYNHVRFYYKDQLLSYGLRRELPGIAEQIQTQSLSTFSLATVPLALEKAHQMGRTRSAPPNKLARFAVTPFVNRVDIYRDAAVIQFNTKWGDLLGNNLIRQWHLKFTNKAVDGLTPTLPQIQTISSLPKEEFQSALVTRDPWHRSRPFIELADELPIQLEDLFSEPPVGRTQLSRGPLELLRPFGFPKSSGNTLTEGTFQSVQGRGLHQWLRFCSTKTSPPSALVAVLPLADLSPQDLDTPIETLNKARQNELVERMGWQTLVDMTAPVKTETFVRTLISKKQWSLVAPPDSEALKSRQRRGLRQNLLLNKNPIFFRWKRYRGPKKEKRKLKIPQSPAGRKAAIARIFNERNENVIKYNLLSWKHFYNQFAKRKDAINQVKKAYAQEQYAPTPFWEFYGQHTIKKTRGTPRNTLFQLTPHEILQLHAGSPQFEAPRPPRNPDDFLPVYSPLQLRLPTLQKPRLPGIRLQALQAFLQQQAQVAGQGMKEGLLTLGHRILRGAPSRRVLEASQPVGGLSTSGGSENILLRSLKNLAALRKEVKVVKVSRAIFLARIRAKWSRDPEGQYLRAVYAYRRGLKHYNKNYSAPRTRYIKQVEDYKHLVRQAREIRSLWGITLPSFLAQQMQGSYGIPTRVSQRPLEQLMPLPWADTGSTLRGRFRTPPSTSSSAARRKLQGVVSPMQFWLRMFSSQTTGPAPALQFLYAALPLREKGAETSTLGVGQFSDVRVQQKMLGWIHDFYSLLRKYDLSKGSVDPEQVPISRAARHFLELRPLASIVELDPLAVWVDGFLAGNHSFETPIGFPAGFEYHWAHSMQSYAQAHRPGSSWSSEVQKVQSLGDEDVLTSQLVTAIWQKVHQETTDYLDKVHALQVTPEDRAHFKEALEYAQLLLNIRMYRQLGKEITSLVDSTLGIGYIRAYTQALSQSIPKTRPIMHGFLFPDKTYEESHKELQAAQRRYGLLNMSPWDVFKTVFARRPFEVFLPPGWRPFNETVFSSEAAPMGGVLPNRFPHSLVEDPAKIPVLARPASRLSRREDTEMRKLRQLPRLFTRLLRRVEKPRAGMLDIQYGSVGSQDLVDKRKAPKVPSMEEWANKYLLGRGNVFKDSPLTFRGQRNRFHVQTTATAPDQIQLIRTQMGLRPFHKTARFAFYRPAHQIQQTQKKRIPFKRQGYRRRFFHPLRGRKLRTIDQRTLGWKRNKINARIPRMLRQDLYPSGSAKRREELRFIRRKKHESWRNWLSASFSNGRSMLQPRINRWPLQVKVAKYRQLLREEEWDQLVEKASESRGGSSFTVKMPWDAFKSGPVNSLRIQGRLWPRKYKNLHGLYLVSPKDRLATLTQMTTQLTRLTPGVSNEIGYSNIVNTFNYFDQQERFGLSSPFVSHLVIPGHALLPEPTGAPLLLSSSTSDIFTFAQPRWIQAERLIQQQLLLKQYWQGKWELVLDFVDKLPGVKGLKALLHTPYYKRNYEPITHYWWCYGGQLVFFIWAFRAYRYALKETWNELVDILFDNFPMQPLREVMNDLGLYDPFTYRIILESPNNFSTSAGSLSKRLFYQTCEVILGLRNLRTGGRSRRYLPKGILFTGVPGTGKTYLVQMLAGAAAMPVITQTASELFDQETVAGLGIEDVLLTPADQLSFAFDRARELAPCIFFVDELDALGTSRGSLITSTGEVPDPEEDPFGYARVLYPGVTDTFKPHMSDEERSARELLAKNTIEDLRDDNYRALTHGRYPGSNRLRTGLLFWHQDKARVARALRIGTLTEFLVQMDGLRYFSGVLVIGATNRLASIDPALIRPGRLERVIQLHPLSTRQRIDVLRRQCARVGTVPSINWRYLANRTRGATAANLATAVNHSAVRALISDSLHTVETLEYGLDTMTRHKLARQMISMRPLPKISASKAQDPFKFLRIAYYNAGKVIVHNILPGHLSLPYAKLAAEPFDPDWTLDELVLKQKTRQQLDSMLIGLYAGKAAEFAMLYRDTPDAELSVLLQLSESDQGSQELMYGTELANAIVDGWYLLEEQRLASRLSVVDNESYRNIRMPVDLETRDALDYWTDNHGRLFAHLAAELDTPEIDTDTKTFTPGITIHQRHEELAFWALSLSRLYLSAVSTRYSTWSKFELRQPWQSERSRFWVPPDLYYHQEPGSLDDFERLVKFVRPQERKTRKNTLKNKQQRPKQWQKVSKHWDKPRFKDWKPEAESYDLAGRQMITFPAWQEMDRDYLLQLLVRRAFEASSLIFHDHMELLDRMATYLLKHRIIREDKIQEIIFEYTADRYKSKLPLAIPLTQYFEPYGSYRIPQVNIHGAKVPPLIGPVMYVRPTKEFECTENNHYLVYQRAWLSNTPIKRVPLDVFEHTFDPYASRDGWWVKQDSDHQIPSDSTSPDAKAVDALKQENSS